MFAFFKRKRIDKYTLAASKYTESTYVPSPQEQFGKDLNHIRFKLPVNSGNTEDKISETDKKRAAAIERAREQSEVKYSLRGSGVPKFEDIFQAASVQLAFRRNPTLLDAGKLVRELDQYLDVTFSDAIARYIREDGWRDSDVYKAAQIDRRLFSKIMSDRHYKPSKDTAIALAIALELSLKQAEDLLSRAGYTLSHSSKRDVIIEYFIREGIYNLSDINEVLYRLDQKILGR